MIGTVAADRGITLVPVEKITSGPYEGLTLLGWEEGLKDDLIWDRAAEDLAAEFRFGRVCDLYCSLVDGRDPLEGRR